MEKTEPNGTMNLRTRLQSNEELLHSVFNIASEINTIIDRLDEPTLTKGNGSEQVSIPNKKETVYELVNFQNEALSMLEERLSSIRYRLDKLL
jgi:hypothetical protein